MCSWESISAGLFLVLSKKKKRGKKSRWWRFCLFIIVYLNAWAVTQCLFIIYAKWCRNGCWCSASELHLCATQHPSLLLLLLLCSSLSCVLPYSLISSHSALLINCACLSRPKTALCCPLHPFISRLWSSRVFLNILTPCCCFLHSLSSLALALASFL